MEFPQTSKSKKNEEQIFKEFNKNQFFHKCLNNNARKIIADTSFNTYTPATKFNCDSSMNQYKVKYIHFIIL